jgi:hypothetical protein
MPGERDGGEALPASTVSPNDADRAGAGSGAEPGEDSGAGYGNHAMPDLEGEPGDTSKDES